MSSTQTTHPDRKDELLTLLADAHRRRILAYLQEATDGVATVQELTNEIDKQDHGGSEATQLRLVHSDLPRLEEAGIVEFDQRSQTVRYHGSRPLERLLKFVVEL